MKEETKNVEKIVVKTQEDINKIPLDFDGNILICENEEEIILIPRFINKPTINVNKGHVKIDSDTKITANESSITAEQNSSVTFASKSYISLFDHARCVAAGSFVYMHDHSKCEACTGTKVSSYSHDTMISLYSNSEAKVESAGKIIGHDKSVIFPGIIEELILMDESTAYVYSKCKVNTFNRSSAYIRENNIVDSYDESTIIAIGCDNNINAYANSRIIKDMDGNTITIHDNAQCIDRLNSKDIAYKTDVSGDIATFYVLITNHKNMKKYIGKNRVPDNLIDIENKVFNLDSEVGLYTLKEAKIILESNVKPDYDGCIALCRVKISDIKHGLYRPVTKILKVVRILTKDELK